MEIVKLHVTSTNMQAIDKTCNHAIENVQKTSADTREPIIQVVKHRTLRLMSFGLSGSRVTSVKAPLFSNLFLNFKLGLYVGIYVYTVCSYRLVFQNTFTTLVSQECNTAAI